jgi:hypothetical protein
MLASMDANKCKCLIAGCLASSMFLGAHILLPTELSAATQDAQNPAELTIDGKIKKIPEVVGDHFPTIELPEKLEILPPRENNPVANDGDSDVDNDNGAVTKLPVVHRDFSKLPKPVAQMRKLIMEVAISGKIEDLRQLIGSGEDITMLSLGGIDGDPVEFIKSLSGDNQGHEILAILLEVLEAGYVHLDVGTDHELYVWPYFFAWPLDKLTAVQKVELFRIVTAGDFEDMQSFGGYIFYRVGITPQGRWRFFVAGD